MSTNDRICQVITALHQGITSNSVAVSHATRGNEQEPQVSLPHRSSQHLPKRKQTNEASSNISTRGRAGHAGHNASSRGSVMFTEIAKIHEDQVTTEEDNAIAKRLNTSETDDLAGPITSGPSPDPYKFQKRDRTGTLTKNSGSQPNSRLGGMNWVCAVVEHLSNAEETLADFL